MKSKLFFFVLASVLTFTPLASAETHPAQQTIETFAQNIKAMEFPAKDAAKQAALVKATDTLFDLESMGRKALGDNWTKAGEEDQKNFIDLLWKLIQNVAYPKSRKFMGEYQITYPEVKAAGEGFDVYSVIKQEEQALDASVVYHVSQKDQQWKVDDVVLDGVSIIEDLKYQFDKLIEKSQFSGLLAKMKERLAQAEKENGIPA